MEIVPDDESPRNFSTSRSPDNLAGLRETHDFGITISCHYGDKHLLSGLLASIKEFLPNVPICLIKHGIFSTLEFERAYGLLTIEQCDVDERLAPSYGYGLTKMIAFWHSPFERFLHMDPDAICWGNMVDGMPIDDYDLIYNEPHEVITEDIQRYQYFDPSLVEPLLKGWDWRGRAFFNTGIFMGRRGIFDIDDYLEILEFQRRVPGSLFTDQGPMALLTFKALDDGRIKAKDWPLQAVVPVISVQELHKRFHLSANRPIVNLGDQRLVHWAGKKPLNIENHPFREPMNHFRYQHLKNIKSSRRALGTLGLAIEELHMRYTGYHGGSYRKAAKSRLRSVARAWLRPE